MAKQEDDTEYGKWLWDGFRTYLAEKYNDNRSFDWSGLILENEADGSTTDTFFRLLHDYLLTQTA